MAPLVSIVIPTHNHGAYLADAVHSALAQTHPDIEVVIVDDASTDGTDRLLHGPQGFLQDPRVSVYRHAPQRGVSTARNIGLERARGAFVMFLDADDVIAPTKVADQLQEFSPEVGWVICDVQIVDDVRRVTELASDRYRYKHRELGGWIREQLKPSNFIPVMSPLVRREVLGDDLRFGDLQPEDWHFWYAVAGRARVRYLPKVLATYRKRRTGRSRAGMPDVPPVDGPLRLNLGCGTPGALSWHPLEGFLNLDRAMGWCFEDGLPQFKDGTVDGITVSHALMYVDERDIPRVFAEFARVLRPGGVVRITEDDTKDPASKRLGGWRGSEPYVTLTSPALAVRWLLRAGFQAFIVDAETTHYRDRSLMQRFHGDPPDVFFIEGVKP